MFSDKPTSWFLMEVTFNGFPKKWFWRALAKVDAEEYKTEFREWASELEETWCNW